MNIYNKLLESIIKNQENEMSLLIKRIKEESDEEFVKIGKEYRSKVNKNNSLEDRLFYQKLYKIIQKEASRRYFK